MTLNRVPSKSVERTPYELWTRRIPSVSFFKIWGCEAYVKCQMSSNLKPRSNKHYFVWYPKETKGYYFYSKVSNKVFVARIAIFLEEDFISNSRGKDVEFEEIQGTSQDVQESNVPLFPTMNIGVSGSGNEQTTREIVEEIYEPAQVEEQCNDLRSLRYNKDRIKIEETRLRNNFE